MKTLKDLSSFKEKVEVESFIIDKDQFIRGSELKEEVIKWIKASRTNEGIHNDCSENKFYKLFDYSCTACSEGVGMCGTEIIENFITHFFNITEDDLK